MDALNSLVNALRCLPGVGPKSAQRMVYYLLHHQRSKGLHLAVSLQHAMEKIKHCERCNNYTEQNICHLCSNPSRDGAVLCVVESPADITAIEQCNAFTGLYFVLMGKISPLDGKGPEDIGLPKLLSRILAEQVGEVIIALSPSVESFATSHFIYDMLQTTQAQVSQLAHGIPSGGELEFLDGTTIRSALRNRAAINV